jgi:L,D-transpeptidase ErfK/SrfK
MRRVRTRWLLLGALLVLPAPGWAQAELARALSRMPPLVGKPVEYQRKGTESIYRLARQYGVSASAVHNANPGDLRGGDELLLIPNQHIAPLSSAEGVVVNLTERNAYLYRRGKPIRVFPLAIGMRGWETPTGDFRIATKRKNPTWFPPKWAKEEEPVPPGPGNPLGDRWMGLSIPGYGMHATNSPASIGRYASHGCMRMYPEHARALYDRVSIGTPVKIVYQLFSLGYSPEEGIVYLAHYPDPYQLGEASAAEVREQLRAYALADVINEAALAEALARPSGVPAPVVGSRLRVTVGGRTVRFALAPTPAGNDWLAPVGPLAEAMGARLEIGPGGSYAAIERGANRLLLTPDRAEALVNGELHTLETPMRLAAGYPVIPVREIATALGASVGWDEETQTLLIWDEPVLPLPASSFR